MQLQTLSADEVKRIHFALVEEFQSTANRIDPPGVKSENLLASAVSRQHTSLGQTLKYPDAFSNAASLTFGICCDHPFHNGNKRTALVTLLVHLHKNKIAFDGIGEGDLYDLVLRIAKHDIVKTRKRAGFLPGRPPADDEVSAIASWIEANSRSILRGERLVTYRHLKEILGHFNYTLKNAKGNFIDIYHTEFTSGVLFSRQALEIRIGNIPFPGENIVVSVKDIKYIRRLCKLTAEEGVDSETFYGQGEPLDAFIIHYRNIIHRLASK